MYPAPVNNWLISPINTLIKYWSLDGHCVKCSVDVDLVEQIFQCHHFYLLGHLKYKNTFNKIIYLCLIITASRDRGHITKICHCHFLHPPLELCIHDYWILIASLVTKKLHHHMQKLRLISFAMNSRYSIFTVPTFLMLKQVSIHLLAGYRTSDHNFIFHKESNNLFEAHLIFALL